MNLFVSTNRRDSFCVPIPIRYAGVVCPIAVLWLLAAVCSSVMSQDDTSVPRTRRVGSGLILPTATTSAVPWTDKPVLNDPDRFQIAIMTDRTGGHRAGIWARGLRTINMLRPDFVVSVGDLIEGYTEERSVIESQWKEFRRLMAALEMKFFFVAGNHDVTNPVMHKIWREHFGREWYSFDYKGVHFVCLLSEDPHAEIGQEQLQWLKEDLAEHADARWTLVFLHKPLWVYAERERLAGNAVANGWPEVEALLVDRSHTVFAGHTHHYIQFQRNGQQYYQLATTGGGSMMRGRPYGEFDHITWLTMEQDGPCVANVLLDGVLAPDVVTEESIGRFTEFLKSAQTTVAPILLEDGSDAIQRGTIELQLMNRFDEPVELSAEVVGLPLNGLSLDGSQLTVMCEPGESTTLKAPFEFESDVPVERMLRTMLQTRIRALGEDGLSCERSLPVIIDQLHAVPTAVTKVAVDGQLEEWLPSDHTTSVDSLRLGDVSAWKGQEDASMTLHLSQDDRFVYLGFAVRDDRIIPESDGIAFFIDSRSADQRQRHPELGEGVFHGRVEFSEGQPEMTFSGPGAESLQSQILTATQKANDGYIVEVALPIDVLTVYQGLDWTDFQYTAGIVDVDGQTDSPCYVIWRGTSEIRERNTGFAWFRRN